MSDRQTEARQQRHAETFTSAEKKETVKAQVLRLPPRSVLRCLAGIINLCFQSLITNSLLICARRIPHRATRPL